MKERLAPQAKTKILNIGQDMKGAGGVAKWGRLLTDELDEYDIQTFSFTDYSTVVPPNALEFHKADSFINYLKQVEADKNAKVVIGDGFWASTYSGPAKVISIIHGLWHHPLREKHMDDGLVDLRKKLWEYQYEYFKKADSLGHTLVSCSPFVQKLLKEDFGIETKCIPNAIDLDFYDKIRIGAIDSDRPLILHGILSQHKGLDILPAVENHPLIKDKFDIGTIDEIAKAGQCDKAATFKAADVGFMPSKWEASSYLLLEMLANNLPIVALRSGILYCKDLKGIDKIGIILDENDPKAYAEAIQEVYENKHKYMNGRQFLIENNMTLDKWTASMRKLIGELTNA
jgi:glycosyltransferase involved in cell wall biosynthesis